MKLIDTLKKFNFAKRNEVPRKLISICMPMHEMKGYEKFLRKNLDILSNQTFKDFDVVVSDQSKKDNIRRICSEYKDKLDIKYFHNPSGPYTSAYNSNYAIKRATGKLIKMLFLDDFFYHNDAIKDIAMNFDLEKDNWLVTACEHTTNGTDFIRPFYPKYNDQIHLGENTISSPSVLTIKNDKPLLFDKRMLWLMDVDYYRRCYDKFGPPKILNKINVVNTNGDHQASNTTATKDRRAIEYVWVLKKFKEKKLLKEYKIKTMNRTSKLPKPIKKLTISFLKKFGLNDVENVGIYSSLYTLINTKVGLNNGSTREKWLEETLGKLPKGSSILDAGAGELQYKKFCGHLKYTSQDFGGYDGVGNGDGLQTTSWDNSKLDIVSDIIDIPVKDKTFDSIMCVEVFEHISEPARAVKEFSRIIKPGGKLIITAPYCSLNHFAPYYYANGYSKYWYEKILGEYGFTIDKIDFNGNFFEYMGQEIRHIQGMAYKYTKIGRMSWILYYIAQTIILRILNKLSAVDVKSHELLCFGLHVVATKK